MYVYVFFFSLLEKWFFHGFSMRPKLNLSGGGAIRMYAIACENNFRRRPNHPPAKIISTKKKIRRTPPVLLPTSAAATTLALPPTGSVREGNCRHRCRPPLASLRLDLGGTGLIAAAAALSWPPPAGSGREGDCRCRCRPPSGLIWEGGGTAAATISPPSSPPWAGSGREGRGAAPTLSPRRCRR